ncbi:MAG TPA: HAD family hydrolase [Bacteroidia bacterium]
MSKAIILDLDDTIFRTKSMDSKIFQPFFEFFTHQLKSIFEEQVIENINEDLWRFPWDHVIAKYSIPYEIVVSSIDVMNQLSFDLNIVPYSDYDFIETLPYPKYLVTTGLSALQKAKIEALKIGHGFDKIVINDTFLEAKSKLDIFTELRMEFGLNPEHTYIIGDNPNSEIKAGNELNMVTIQILREGVTKGHNAQHYIHSFYELEQIMK